VPRLAAGLEQGVEMGNGCSLELEGGCAALLGPVELLGDRQNVGFVPAKVRIAT
jgi:hypothetical protein